MIRKSIWILMVAIFASCNNEQHEESSMLNDTHLSHLYESWDVDGAEIGGIWIYCEAPDYNLVTDEDEGFTCVDDVARSLVYYSRAYEKGDKKTFIDKLTTLTSFILLLQADNGFFYNFVFPDKSINKTHANSVAEANWWSWRAFWALSEVLLIKDEVLSEIQGTSRKAMEKLLPAMLGICSDSDSSFVIDGIATPLCAEQMGGDQIALLMIGLSNYYELFPTAEVKAQLKNLGEVLVKTQFGDESKFPYGAFLSWQNIWHAWGNSQAYAMLRVGQVLENDEFIASGIKEVKNFYPYFLQDWPSNFKIGQENDTIKIIEQDKFPQIAYNLRPMIFASLEAFNLTKDEVYADQVVELAMWYFGENQANQQMYDPATGRTFDGIISANEVNRNSGAESTVEALLALQAISRYPTILEKLNIKLKK